MVVKISKTKFEEMYYSLPLSEVAKQLEVNITTVSAIRKKLGLAPKGRKFSGRKPKIILE